MWLNGLGEGLDSKIFSLPSIGTIHANWVDFSLPRRDISKTQVLLYIEVPLGPSTAMLQGWPNFISLTSPLRAETPPRVEEPLEVYPQSMNNKIY